MRRARSMGFGVLGCVALLGCGDDDGPRATEPDASVMDTSTPDAGAEPDARPSERDAARRDDGSMPDAGAPVDAGPTVPPLPALDVSWSPCGGERVECADVEVPLDWADPEGATITMHVERIRAIEPSGRSLWMLMGGPGQAGSAGEGIAGLLQRRDFGLDVYLPDHRGTGRSTRLECVPQESDDSPGGWTIEPEEWPPCRDSMVAEWGEEGLSHFSSTQAARDVAGLIGSIHADDEQVFVMGISYGTYLANRYLQIAPTQADGVVFDSMCGPRLCHISEQDIWENDEAREILARCVDEPECASRLGPDPWATLGNVFADVATGSCPFGETPAVDLELFRAALGTMMFAADLRQGTPAFIHRMGRCNEADRRAILITYRSLFGLAPSSASPGRIDSRDLARSRVFQAHAQNRWLPSPPLGGPGTLDGYSFPLAINIVISELWEDSDPSPEELVARWDETYSCRGASRQSSWQVPGWPRYVDPLVDITFDSPDTPVLVMNAEHDPATPAWLAREFAGELHGEHQRYVEIPGSGHSVIIQGPLMHDARTTCGRELLLQFVLDPRAELDTSCLDETEPMTFDLSRGLSSYLFGTFDPWGDPTDS